MTLTTTSHEQTKRKGLKWIGHRLPSSFLGCCCVLLSAIVAAAETSLPQILPEPQQIHALSGEFDLCHAEISLTGKQNSADIRSAQILTQALNALCGDVPKNNGPDSSGLRISLEDDATQSGLPGVNQITGAQGRESYKIEVTPAHVVIHAHSAAGMDYGVQSLLQCIRNLPKTHPYLPALTIDDWPSLPYRGLMLDTAHGSRPTLDFMHRLLDTMEIWKLNQLYLYAETNLPFSNPTPAWHDNAWSRTEIKDLVDYAAARHIDVVPCVELYGHLHDLLAEESQSPLGAMRHGGELNPADPRTSTLVSNWMQQIAQMFPSPFLHMGFDEPFELDRMDAVTRHNISPDKLWSDHLRKSAELAATYGKKPMFWADIDEGAFLFNKYPQLASQLPPEAIAVPWFYDSRPDYSPLLDLFKRYNVPIFVAPAISDWDDIFPDYNTSFTNIQGMITAGRAIGAQGAINTIWSDSVLALHRTAWPGIAYGAAVAWQSSPVSSQGFFFRYALSGTGSSHPQLLASIYQDLTLAETMLKTSLGEEPAYRIFDMPFDASYLSRARAHREELIQARLHIESALNALHLFHDMATETDELLTLTAEARCMDYSAMHALYAAEIADNFLALPTYPNADDLHYRLGWETASRNHSRVGDLIDRSGECLESYRKAWLSEALPYRLAAAEARWTHEQQFWIDFQEKIWRLRREFKEGDPRPTLEQVLRRNP